MKSFVALVQGDTIRVTLYARVWIEMYNLKHTNLPDRVTLYARVWIEILLDASVLPYS